MHHNLVGRGTRCVVRMGHAGVFAMISRMLADGDTAYIPVLWVVRDLRDSQAAQRRTPRRFWMVSWRS